MKQRNMLILWHWKRIRKRNREEGSKQPFEFIPVAPPQATPEQERRMVILDEGNRTPQEILQNLREIMLHEQKGKKQTPIKGKEWLLCLHKDSFDQRKYEDLEKQLSPLIEDPKNNLRLISFGGGDHFIYYKKLTKTGLLDQFGRFMHGNCQIANNEDDPWEFRSVLTETSNLKDPLIETRAFDQVWDYYRFHCKRALYEFQEKLFTRFVASLQAPEGTHSLSSFLEQEKDELLSEELQKICEGEKLNSERLDQVYRSDQINQLYRSLVEFFESKKFNAKSMNAYLIELRERIDPLLKAMPESIY